MDRTARNILVIALFAGFFISAPAVLLYTSGYRFSWTKNRVEKTGILHVETLPRGAEVSINGRAAGRTSPVTVTRLLPEEYDVRITHAGYLPWQKRLRVESGKTTFAKDVVLIPDTLPRLAAALEGGRAAWTSDAKRLAFVAENDAWTEIRVHDVRTSSTEVLARYAVGTLDDPSVSWSPDGSSLALAATDAGTGEPALYLYDVSRDDAATAVHEVLTGVTARPPAWASDGSALIVAAGGVFSADPRTDDVEPFITAAGIRGVSVGAGGIWSVRDAEDGPVLERRDAAENDATVVAELPKGDPKLVHIGADVIVLADVGRGSGLIVRPATGEVVISSPFTKAVPSSVPGNAGLLLCGEFELAILAPAIALPEAVTRVGEPIIDCAWHPKGTYVFYATRSGITAIEIDARDQRNVHRIAAFDSIDAMIVDPQTGILRFLGAIGAQKGLFERPL